MIEDEKYWLDEHGRREWKRKDNPGFIAERSYHWIDRVVFVDETESYGNGWKKSKYIGETTFTEFSSKNNVLNEWNPVLIEEPEKENEESKTIEISKEFLKEIEGILLTSLGAYEVLQSLPQSIKNHIPGLDSCKSECERILSKINKIKQDE